MPVERRNTKHEIRSTKKEAGFTLIELLVVIAIIGFLAAIIAVNLRSAQNKSANAAVKANLSNARSQVELYFSSNNTYGIYGAATCPTTPGSGHVFLDPGVVNAIAGAKSAGGGLADCWASGNRWSAAVELKVPEDSPLFHYVNFWCIDSAGAGKGVPILPGSGLCP